MEENGKEKRYDNGGRSEADWWQPAVIMFIRLSGWIVAPVLVGAFLGKWLDHEFNTEPWLFIASIGTAFIISMVGLARNVTKEYNKIENEASARRKRSHDEKGKNNNVAK